MRPFTLEEVVGSAAEQTAAKEAKTEMLRQKKLSLKSFNAIDPAMVFKPPEPKPEPPSLMPRPEKTEEPVASPPKKGWEASALWCQLPGSQQFLRVVLDDRVNIGKRIYRIELWDKLRKERIAIFRRQTEATRR